MQNINPEIMKDDYVISDSFVKNRLTSLFSIGTWKYNFITGEFFVDKSLLQMLGSNHEGFKNERLESILDLVHPREKHFFDFLKPSFKFDASDLKPFECRILHECKDWMWIENHCEVVSYIENGNPEWLVGYAQDITEKKNKDLLFIRNKALLDKTNEVANIGTWEFHLKDEIVNWSSVTKKIHEVSVDFVPDINAGLNFYKEGVHRDKISYLFNKCITEGEEFDTELIIITQNNTEKWVRVIGIPVLEKGVCTRVYGVFQDINEKTKALKELSITEEKFRKTFDFAGVGMALVGMDTKWLRVNESLCNMLGYSEEELLKLPYGDYTHLEDLDNDKQLLDLVLSGELDSYRIGKRYIHKDGEIIWAMLTVSVVKDDQEKPIHFVSQINDITEIKQAEQKVNKLLEITKDQNDRLLNFAHIVSHNLRSHAGNLGMLLDLIELEIPDVSENEMFPLLKDAVGQLDETVQNLNEVAVLNTKTNLNLEVLELKNYVTKAISNINSIVLDDSVTIINNVCDTINVSAIPAYLDSIILNFLTNTLKYQSPERKLIVTISAEHKDDFIVLSIQDNGVGIDLDVHGDKLFGMYKTFHKHKDARGLGLFITKNQIQAMNGSVDVKSVLNEGSTFYISFLNENQTINQ